MSQSQSTKKGRKHGSRDRYPRFTRADVETRPGMVLTVRDMEILQMVCDYRMTLPEQVQRLVMPTTHISQVRLRLRKLFHNGYLHRAGQWQKHGEPPASFVYFLDEFGVAALAEYNECDLADIDWAVEDRETGPLHQHHWLYTNDFRLDLTLSAKKWGVSVEWRDEKTVRRLHQNLPVKITLADGTKRTARAIPDGYLVLDGNTRKRGFVEAVHTDTKATLWKIKVQAMNALYNSGLYHQHYRSKALTIWTVTLTETKLKQLLNATVEAGGERRWWFTSRERLEKTGADILTDKIWSIATSDEWGSLVGAPSTGAA